MTNISLQPGNTTELKPEGWRLKSNLSRILKFPQVLGSGIFVHVLSTFILIAVGGSFRCQSDWVKYLDDNFEEVICGGNDET